MTPTLGSRLRTARLAAHLTQQELASRAGLAVSTVSSAEQDRTNPDTETLTAIADVCGVSLDWLKERKVTT